MHVFGVEAGHWLIIVNWQRSSWQERAIQIGIGALLTFLYWFIFFLLVIVSDIQWLIELVLYLFLGLVIRIYVIIEEVEHSGICRWNKRMLMRKLLHIDRTRCFIILLIIGLLGHFCINFKFWLLLISFKDIFLNFKLFVFGWANYQNTSMCRTFPVFRSGIFL